MMKRILGLAAAMLVATGAQAVTVPDGSFETPQTSSYIYNPTNVAGVTFNAGSGVQSNGSAWGFAAAPDGNQTAFIQSTSNYIGQITFALTDLVVGQAYQVLFFGSSRNNYSDNPFTVSIGGTQVGSYDLKTPSWSQYTSSTFTATSTSANLSFLGSASTGDSDVGIDNVRVASVASVPEPASWAMMIGGFGLIGLTLRRRKGVGAIA